MQSKQGLGFFKASDNQSNVKRILLELQNIKRNKDMVIFPRHLYFKY